MYDWMYVWMQVWISVLSHFCMSIRVWSSNVLGVDKPENTKSSKFKQETKPENASYRELKTGLFKIRKSIAKFKASEAQLSCYMLVKGLSVKLISKFISKHTSQFVLIQKKNSKKYRASLGQDISYKLNSYSFVLEIKVTPISNYSQYSKRIGSFVFFIYFNKEILFELTSYDVG